MLSCLLVLRISVTIPDVGLTICFHGVLHYMISGHHQGVVRGCLYNASKQDGLL
jgi:hypothetical protein